MKFAEFKQQIEAAYKAAFGKSFVACKVYRCLGTSLTIDCLMAENERECPNNIAGNDMIRASFMIHMPSGWTAEDDLPENMTMTAIKSSIKTKPAESIYYCDYRKISYRKTTGNAEKLIAAFGKYVDRLHGAIVEEYKNNHLLDFDMELVRMKHYAA